MHLSRHTAVVLLLVVGPCFGQTPQKAGRSSQESASARRAQVLASLRPDDPETAAVVKNALADPDWYVRATAARMLARIGDKSYAELLLPLLSDSSWLVREQAIDSLGTLAGIRDAVGSVKALGDSDVYARASLIRALGRAPDTAATAAAGLLIPTLSDPEPLIRKSAALSLGDLKSSKSVDALIGLLKDEDQSVRRAAARSLGKIGERRALEAVLAADKEPYDWEFAAAACRLGDFSKLERLKAAAGSDYADRRFSAVQTLIELRDQRVLDILKPLTKPPATSNETSESLAVRRTIAEGLGSFSGDQARTVLIAMLDDPAPAVRVAAISSLGKVNATSQTPDSSAEDAIVKVLQRDEVPAVIGAALDVVPSLNRSSVTDSLLAARGKDGKLPPNVARGLSAVGVTTESQVSRLSDPDPESRIMSIQRLARLGDPAALKPLTELLSSDKDLRVRVKAAEALAELGDKRAVEPLMSAAAADSPDLRSAAVGALGKLGDHTSVDALFTAAHDDNAGVRSAAVSSLSLMGISVDRVAADLSNPNWQARSAALTTLERLGDRSATPAVVRVLAADEDPRVRGEAARALGALGDQSTTDVLLRALSDQSSEVRVQAATSLGRLKSVGAVPALSNLLNDRDQRVSIAAAEALARMRDGKATRVLIDALSNSDGAVRARAAHVIARVSAEKPLEEAASALARAVTDQDAVVRYYAVEALSTLGSKAVPYLIEVLKTPRQSDRDRAARVLWRIGAPSVEPLIAIVQDRTSTPEMRASAAYALGVIGDSRAVKSLALLLRDERYFVRQAAGRALSLIGEAALSQLMEMANSSTIAVRESAIEALGSFSSPKAINRVVEALREPNANVRAAAVRALGDSGTELAVTELSTLLRDESSPLRSQAGAALARIGAIAVPSLIKALSDSRPSVRQLAAEALGDIGSPEAAAPLADLVRRDTSGARLEAVEALGKIGDKSALSTLLGLSKSPSVPLRKKTIAALARFRTPEVAEALMFSLSDTDEEVRFAAAGGLGEVGDERAIPALEKLVDRDPSSDVRSAAAQSIERLRSQTSRKQSRQ